VLALPARGRAESPTLAATRLTSPPRIDGHLDDLAWRDIPGTDAFTQKFPAEGTRPVERTLLKVAYDREALYVAFDCEQRRAPIIGRLTRRDRPIESDWVAISIDTRGAGTGAFEFMVNAAGVLSDALRFDDTEVAQEWDENWDARVARSETGWTAELRIPLRALRFDALPVQRWGLQARRYVSARQETDEWAFIPRTTAGEVSRYGALTELRRLRAPSPFELRPFALVRLRRQDPGEDTLARGWDAGGSAGLDLKWHLTQNLTLDLAFNPDFAQVEADQAFLNLTNYEIELPEKRPFFLEGIDVFSTPVQLLYTRRIGLAPPVPALRSEAPFGERLVDAPAPSILYGAAKLIGTLGKRVTVGVLSALTGRNTVEVELEGGHRLHRIAAPMQLSNALRVRVLAAPNVELGMLATTANRFEPTGLYPIVPAGGQQPTFARCPGGEEVGVSDRCFHDAYSGGLDLRWRSASGNYAARAQAVMSGLSGGPPRTQRDGTTLASGDLGVGGHLYLAKEGGAHWLGNVTYEVASERLELNDVGYLGRQNRHHVFAQIEYRHMRPWRRLLEAHVRAEFFDRETLAGLNIDRGYQLNASGKLQNFWSWFVELHYRPDHFDDREVGDGTALERGGVVGVELELASDPRKRVWGEVFTQTQPLLRGGLRLRVEGRLVVRATPQLDFELLPDITYTFGEPRFAGDGTTGRHLYGQLTALGVGATVRATYTFLPRLSLQLYTQIFLAQRRYGDMLTAIGWHSDKRVELGDLRPTSDRPVDKPDSAEGIVNVNLVLRWEYRLGSTLFFVYTHAQAPGALPPGQPATFDPGALRRGRGSDVLLLKLTYWFG
jgi:hypothetical protein